MTVTFIEKLGPAKKAAFDENGQPTKAALGFARDRNGSLQLETIPRRKANTSAPGNHSRPANVRSAPGILKEFMLSIPFRKSMRWGSYDLRFARPVHWILAIYGGSVIPVKIEDIESGNTSYGHRFRARTRLRLRDLKIICTKPERIL